MAYRIIYAMSVAEPEHAADHAARRQRRRRHALEPLLPDKSWLLPSGTVTSAPARQRLAIANFEVLSGATNDETIIPPS